MLRIQEWQPEDRPYEKAQREGLNQLSVPELFAILLGGGTREQNVLELAHTLSSYLQALNGADSPDESTQASPRMRPDLKALKQISLTQLCQIKGIGQVKGIRLLAAVELGKRLNQIELEPKQPILDKPDLVAHYVWDRLERTDLEQLYALFVNIRLNLLQLRKLSQGSLSACEINPREIFRQALMDNAYGLFLIHNHPSGDPTPSTADLVSTHKLIQLGREMGIPVLDHLILGSATRFTSLRRENPELFKKREKEG